MNPNTFQLLPVPSTAEIREILVRRIDQQKQAVGIVVGVIEPTGRRVIAFGNLAKGDPRTLDGDTIFEIGSVTKVLTSLLLAEMVSRKEVALDDPAPSIFPMGSSYRSERQIHRAARSFHAQLRAEPHQAHIEVLILKGFDFDAEQIVVPTGVFCQLVIGDDVRAFLRFAQVIEQMTGTSVSSNLRAASRRPWPAMMPAFVSTRIGLLKPNSAMLAAI
jgi:beta-lactamase family protein